MGCAVIDRQSFAEVLLWMARAGATLRLRAIVPARERDSGCAPAEVAVFEHPKAPGGSMVFGRLDGCADVWVANFGERSAISILLAKMKEQA